MCVYDDFLHIDYNMYIKKKPYALWNIYDCKKFKEKPIFKGDK